MSALEGKADMTVCGCLLSRSLLGVKRTWAGAVQMSAFDPKRTSTVRKIGTVETVKSVSWGRTLWIGLVPSFNCSSFSMIASCLGSQIFGNGSLANLASDIETQFRLSA